MKLSRIIKNIKPDNIDNLTDFTLRGITDNSKDARLGFLFFAITGESLDGSDFIEEAIKKGAQAIVVSSDKKIKNINKTLIYVKDVRVSLSRAAAEFYGSPSTQLNCIGVTGTNGKTTITYILESIFKQVNINTGVIGTINYRFNDKVIKANNTTPSSLFLQKILSDMKKSNVSHCVLEVSSHSLEQERVGGINFKYAIFTNLSSDHLDYHKDKMSYFAAKKKLFKILNKDAHAVINIDDEYGQKLIKVAQANIITYSIDTPSDIRAEDLNFDSEGMTFNIVASNAKFKIRASLIGRHNVYNILAAFAVGFCENIASEDIIAGISNLEGVPGRLERIKGDYPFSVFIDYAHTENALQNVLATLGKIKQNRLILVFGCGGNRDTTKRAKMGRIAEDMADSVIITSDNPRNENPQGIIKDILSGIKNKDKCDIILERYSAITKALSLAEEGDIVLIAGKGHEQYQILKNKKIHFDDRKTAKNILDKKFNIE